MCDRDNDMITDETTSDATIDDLPYVVLEYILSHLSPYKELIDCKLVSKSWYMTVNATIAKLKSDFTKSLINRSLVWSHFCPSSGPSISPRYSHSACCVDDSMYVFGGCTTANTTFNDLWRFDLSSRSWIRPIATGTFPSPKACASLVEYRKQLILFGGWTQSSPYPIHQEYRIFNHIHVFDTLSNRWSAVALDSYGPAIAGHSASIIGHQMIVFGGLQSEANNPMPFSASNDIWILNLRDFVWSKPKTSHLRPLARYGHSQVVLDDRHILIVGGSGGPNMLFSDIWMLCIPEDMSSEWQWKPIEVINKETTVGPQISFHPTCKFGNLLVVLSADKKVRSVQCKDSTIFRKPSIRSQYVSGVEANAAPSPRLEPQPGPSQPKSAEQSSGRPFSRKNRQRQLEGLDRMAERIRLLKAIADKACSPLSLKNATVRTNIESPQNPMQLFVLDISQVVATHTAKWVDPKTNLCPKTSEGPEEMTLYSLIKGRNEIIMFGGIQKDKNMRQQPIDSPLNNVPEIVSNQLHIITSKMIVI